MMKLYALSKNEADNKSMWTDQHPTFEISLISSTNSALSRWVNAIRVECIVDLVLKTRLM